MKKYIPLLLSVPVIFVTKLYATGLYWPAGDYKGYLFSAFYFSNKYSFVRDLVCPLTQFNSAQYTYNVWHQPFGSSLTFILSGMTCFGNFYFWVFLQCLLLASIFLILLSWKRFNTKQVYFLYVLILPMHIYWLEFPYFILNTLLFTGALRAFDSIGWKRHYKQNLTQLKLLSLYIVFMNANRKNGWLILLAVVAFLILDALKNKNEQKIQNKVSKNSLHNVAYVLVLVIIGNLFTGVVFNQSKNMRPLPLLLYGQDVPRSAHQLSQALQVGTVRNIYVKNETGKKNFDTFQYPLTSLLGGLIIKKDENLLAKFSNSSFTEVASKLIENDNPYKINIVSKDTTDFKDAISKNLQKVGLSAPDANSYSTSLAQANPMVFILGFPNYEILFAQALSGAVWIASEKTIGASKYDSLLSQELLKRFATNPMLLFYYFDNSFAEVSTILLSPFKIGLLFSNPYSKGEISARTNLFMPWKQTYFWNQIYSSNRPTDTSNAPPVMKSQLENGVLVKDFNNPKANYRKVLNMNALFIDLQIVIMGILCWIIIYLFFTKRRFDGFDKLGCLFIVLQVTLLGALAPDVDERYLFEIRWISALIFFNLLNNNNFPNRLPLKRCNN